MADKFKNKYRIESARLWNWDYSWNGCYFVTICTQDREHYFGEIFDDEMQLSDIGRIAQKFWLEIPQHFLDVKLDEFIVMPNHIHGILIIDKNEGIDIKNGHADMKNGHAAVETLHCNVSTTAKPMIIAKPTTTAMSIQKRNIFYSRISPKLGSLSTIIRSYKSVCTKNINRYQNKIFFAWQTRFYDHVIRNEKSLNYIREYIRNNPKNWKDDRNNQDIINPINLFNKAKIKKIKNILNTKT